MTALYTFIYWIAGLSVTILHWRENGFGDASMKERVIILAPATVALVITGVVAILGSVRVSSRSLLW